MSAKIYKDGAWQDVTSVKEYVNGAWVEKDAISVYDSASGTWVEKWTSFKRYYIIQNGTFENGHSFAPNYDGSAWSTNYGTTTISGSTHIYLNGVYYAIANIPQTLIGRTLYLDGLNIQQITVDYTKNGDKYAYGYGDKAAITVPSDAESVQGLRITADDSGSRYIYNLYFE